MRKILLFILACIACELTHAQRLVPFVPAGEQYILNNANEDYRFFDVELFQDSLYFLVGTQIITPNAHIKIVKDNLVTNSSITWDVTTDLMFDLEHHGNQMLVLGQRMNPATGTIRASVDVLENNVVSQFFYDLRSVFYFGKYFGEKYYLFSQPYTNVVSFSNGTFQDEGFNGVLDAEVFGDKLYFFKNDFSGLYSILPDGNVMNESFPCDTITGFSILDGSLYVSTKCDDFLYRLDASGSWVPDNLSLDFGMLRTDYLRRIFKTPYGYIGSFNFDYRANTYFYYSTCSYALNNQISLYEGVSAIANFEGKTWAACQNSNELRQNGICTIEKGLKYQSMSNELLRKDNTPSFGYFSPDLGQFSRLNFSSALKYGINKVVSTNTLQLFGERAGLLTGIGSQYISALNGAYAGPIATNYNSEYERRYQRIWQVTQTQIDYHNNHWYEANYSVPPDILEWPGNGDVLNGEPEVLAPFHDVNGNNIYEPLFGDAPDIKGDEAAFYIVGDGREVDSYYQYSEIARNISRFECGVLNYMYKNSTNPSLAHTLFTDYRIVLRDTEQWNNALLGFIVDFDLGYKEDDFIGSDVMRSAIFGYNGDDYDGGVISQNGYGSEVPACGVVGLNVPMYASVYFNNSSNSVSGQPFSNSGIYNYLNGKRLDGQDIINPYTQQVSRYMYSGEVGVGSTWNETNVGNNPGDRRMLISFNLGDLLPNQPYCFSIATLVASDTVSAGSPSINAVNKLKQYIDEIQDFYDSNLLTTNCNQLVGVEEVNEELFGVHVFPNPAREKITIQTTRSFISKIELFNIVGSLVHSDASLRTANASVDVNTYTPGLYSIRIYLEDGTTEVRKIIVE